MSGLYNQKHLRNIRHCRSEPLESRRLLTADFCLPTSLAGDGSLQLPDAEIGSLPSSRSTASKSEHFYWSDGLRIELEIHPRRVAANISAEAWRDTPAFHPDIYRARGVSSELAIFETEQLEIARLEHGLELLGDTPTTAPVFTVKEANSEMVIWDEIIVSMPGGATPDKLATEYQEVADYRRIRGTTDQFVITLHDRLGVETLAFANQLVEHPEVTWSVPNTYDSFESYYIPNDPRFGDLWHLHNTGQGGGLADVDQDLPEAWDVIQGGSTDLTIGVFDDGVAIDHPDLNNWVNPGEVGGNFFDDDGNGWIDDIYGWNFVNDNASSFPTTSTDNHGTAVAGVAAASGDNGIGVTGASYGTPVISGRLFDGESVATTASIAEGIYYLAGRTADGLGTWPAADVVNNSWGGGGPSDVIRDALQWATTEARDGLGVPFLFAAGNDGFADLSYPAKYTTTISGVIAVGAHDNFGERAWYSQHGPGLDIVAASNGGSLAIDTTDRVGSSGYAPGDYTGTGSTGFGGTSSATPLASGIVALLMARADELDIALTAAEVRNLLRANTDLIGDVEYDPSVGKHPEFGFGALNAGSLLENVGRAEISVLSSTKELIVGSSVIDLGQIVLEQHVDLTLFVRNQGTQTLELLDLAASPDSLSILHGFEQASLGPGESTAITVRFEAVDVTQTDGALTIESSDEDEAIFNIDLSAEILVPSAYGNVFENGYLEPFQESAGAELSQIRVYVDENDNGLFDTELHEFSNTTLLEIEDNSTVTSDLTVTDVSSGVIDFEVEIDITHTWTSDLEVTLISPSGTRVQLFAFIGGSGDNFEGTILSDRAEKSILEGTPPFSGRFRPLEPLEPFLDETPNGTWSLEIKDVFDQDIGSLNSWDLRFTTGEPSVLSQPGGYYVFLDLPVGNHVLKVDAAEWTLVSPSAGGHEVQISESTDSFGELNFGLGYNNRFYASVFADTDADGQFDDDESVLPDRLVFIDENGNGMFEEPLEESFLQTTPVDIKDNSTVTSQLDILDFEGEISDLQVRIDIEHTYTADLTVELVPPSGESVLLVQGRGGSGTDFANTIFDDAADAPIADGSAPFTGRFRPEEPLANFAGIDPNGTWTLRVTDDFSQDEGVLREWEIFVLGEGEAGVVTNDHGRAALDLPKGTSSIVLENLPGWQYTSPVDGTYQETAENVPFSDRSFGVQQELATIESVRVGDLGAETRSRVDALTVVFSTEVSIGENAFEVIQRGSNSSEVEVSFSSQVADAQTVVTLDFAGAFFNDGSLVDGNYQLTIFGDAVIDQFGNALDGDEDGTSGGNHVFGRRAADEFYRFYGDIDGNRKVDFLDFFDFSDAFDSTSGESAYRRDLDENDDGNIDFLDFFSFSDNFDTELAFA